MVLIVKTPIFDFIRKREKLGILLKFWNVTPIILNSPIIIELIQILKRFLFNRISYLKQRGSNYGLLHLNFIFFKKPWEFFCFSFFLKNSKILKNLRTIMRFFKSDSDNAHLHASNELFQIFEMVSFSREYWEPVMNDVISQVLKFVLENKIYISSRDI